MASAISSEVTATLSSFWSCGMFLMTVCLYSSASPSAQGFSSSQRFFSRGRSLR